MRLCDCVMYWMALLFRLLNISVADLGTGLFWNSGCLLGWFSEVVHLWVHVMCPEYKCMGIVNLLAWITGQELKAPLHLRQLILSALHLRHHLLSALHLRHHLFSALYRRLLLFAALLLKRSLFAALYLRQLLFAALHWRQLLFPGVRSCPRAAVLLYTMLVDHCGCENMVLVIPLSLKVELH